MRECALVSVSACIRACVYARAFVRKSVCVCVCVCARHDLLFLVKATHWSVLDMDGQDEDLSVA